ncbi:hypothetical protein BKA70DRAFT_340495 [Coprinopsis sp. MPI-PUGE-AT-0042]|nr:hypothetical protein BKA70DRAFT_340495 [Coprinopsis sp. MPI-PUGE-AT-0042]
MPAACRLSLRRLVHPAPLLFLVLSAQPQTLLVSPVSVLAGFLCTAEPIPHNQAHKVVLICFARGALTKRRRMDPELPCAFNSHYNIRDSIVEYEIDLRNELHEETPEPWLFLEDLAGGVSECEVNIPGSASDDFAEAAEDSGPADVAGDVEGSAFSNAAEGAVGAGGLDLAGTKAHLKGAARTLRPRSSLGKLAQGSKPVLGNKVINAPSVKWRLAAALAAQSSSSSNTGDIPDLQDQPQEQQIGCKRKRPRKRKKAKKPSGTFESDAMPPPQQEPLSTDVPMALPFPSSSPPNFPVPAPYNANRVADVKTKHTHRGGKRLKEAKMYTDDPRGQRLFRLRLRVLQRGELHRSDTFSMLHHASYSSTGWSGRRYNPAWRAEVRKAVADPGSDMWNKYLPEFLQLPFAKLYISSDPARLRGSDGSSTNRALSVPKFRREGRTCCSVSETVAANS